MPQSSAVSACADTAPPVDLQSVRTAYLDALLTGDSVRARHLLAQAANAGVAIESLYLDVLEPVMVDVGLLWSAGDVNVAQEHYATAITAGVMAQLGTRWRKAPTSGRLAIVACTAGERHQLGAQMVSDFLEAAGWEVIPLGADTPARDLATLVELERPDAVALSTSLREQIPGVAETLAAIGRLQPRPFVLVGGRAWRDAPDEHAHALGADARVTDPRRMIALLDERFPALAEDTSE